MYGMVWYQDDMVMVYGMTHNITLEEPWRGTKDSAGGEAQHLGEGFSQGGVQGGVPAREGEGGEALGSWGGQGRESDT